MNNPTGQQLRDAGINLAVSHANAVHRNWQERAYIALQHFILHSGKQEFMCEEVREYAEEENLVEASPSARAWGGIIQSAAKNRLIKRVGYGQVKNPRAHHANATRWSAV